MDFIPLPDGVASHVLVPDLGGPDYDNLGFIGYDRRQGWDIDALYKGDLEAARIDWASYERSWFQVVALEGTDMHGDRLTLAAAFIQTWILFGIFHEVLKRPLLRHELSSEASTDPSGKVDLMKHVTVRQAFGEFLAQRHNLEQHLPDVCRCLRAAAMVVSELLDGPTFPKDSLVFQSAFEALAMLIEEVWIALLAFYPGLYKEVMAFVRLDRPTETLQEQPRWCPNLIRRIQTELGNAGLYYASLVPNLVTEQPHDRCDRDLCVASNIENANYAVQHIPEYCHCLDAKCDHKSTNCLCQHLAVPDSLSCAAFATGGFPLIKFQGDRIEIVEYKAGTIFTAISHPWSDGRGNPAANALPVCQIHAIHNYVMAIMNAAETAAPSTTTNTLFWIDTLCVPIREPLRNTAILGMAKVYSSSYKTLVLSTDLMAIKTPSAIYETLIRIFCSKWSTRLWLMQEAALASDLVFQFRDGPINHTTLSTEAATAFGDSTSHSSILALSALSQVNSTIKLLDSNTDGKTCSLNVLWHGLRFRTSSRPSDAAICGSILLGLDLTKILASHDEEKMQTFWSCQTRIPTNILFSDGPRLEIDGLRWAPSSLLNPRNHASIAYSSEAQPTNDGLLVSGLAAIVFEIPTASRTAYKEYRFLLPGTLSRFYFMLLFDEEPWPAVIEELGPDWDGCCALLLAEELQGTGVLCWAALTVPSQAREQIECEAATENPISARFVCSIQIWYEDEWETRFASALKPSLADDWATNQGRRFIWDLGEVKQMKTSQQYCVS